MGLFFKDSIENIRPNTNSIAPEPVGIGYNEVLDYLVALPDDDYEKLLKVANIYRRAERQVADVLNPTSADAPDATEEPADKPAPKSDSEDSDLDEIVEGFLETNETEAKGDTNNG